MKPYETPCRTHGRRHPSGPGWRPPWPRLYSPSRPPPARFRMSDPRIAFVAAEREPAQRALTELEAACPHVGPDEADVIVALGGDGLMLETLHRFQNTGNPLFGMPPRSVGFLIPASAHRNHPRGG